MRIRHSLREGISASTHCFFGYFPRRGHTDLWFLPKAAPMPSGLCVFSQQTGAAESGPQTPRTAAGGGIHLEAICHAVNRGLNSGRDVHLEGCQVEGETTDDTRPLNEEMESLLSLVEIARLGFSLVTTEENAEFEFDIGERDTKRASDSSVRPFATSIGFEVLIRPDPDDNPIRPLANDARYHFKNQVFGGRKENGLFSSTSNGGLVSGLRLVKRHHPPNVSVVPDPHPGAEAEVVGNHRSPGAAQLGGTGPASAREAVSREIARDICEDGRHPELQQQEISELGQRRGQADSQLEELLRSAGRSRVRHDRMQRRHEEGRSPRRRRISEYGKQKNAVSATGQGLPTNPVKGIRGRVYRSRISRSSSEAGGNPQTWRSEKESSPQQQATSCWKMRQEALAALEGRIRTSAETKDAKEKRAGDQPDGFHRVPPSPSMMRVLSHMRGKKTSSGTYL
ncbi:uncharacterized protein LY79DRAFT_534048 [Colletotrichum navitas]|uniref:Uncharacterized protein n=1 Tax=Colletotrichum navitas TaxID=681940 RepID=A0AAD8QDC8_9PEZI|nr:uncharacterized protein LY79DRAFT_534048 [Colletotrichum navitas]KAK1600571.1 hypothetical protein LY79DRAFT_534048 [Colletotrichum navitas]